MSPDPGVGSLTMPKQNPLRIKHTKQTGKQFKNDLDPKVYPTLYFISQQSRQFCDTVAEPTVNTGLCFAFCVHKMSR